jgi:hypothetical protein
MNGICDGLYTWGAQRVTINCVHAVAFADSVSATGQTTVTIQLQSTRRVCIHQVINCVCVFVCVHLWDLQINVKNMKVLYDAIDTWLTGACRWNIKRLWRSLQRVMACTFLDCMDDTVAPPVFRDKPTRWNRASYHSCHFDLLCSAIVDLLRHAVCHSWVGTTWYTPPNSRLHRLSTLGSVFYTQYAGIHNTWAVTVAEYKFIVAVE